MSILERLLAKGAYSCAGDLILRNVTMGHFRNGDFTPTAEGLKEVEIEDVEVVEVKAPRRKKADLADEAAGLVDIDNIG